jgi:hypothetical protein
MDVPTLLGNLQASFSPDKAARDASAIYLESLPFPDSLPLLLQITSSPDVDVSIRQSSAVTTKNMVRKQWKDLSTRAPAPASSIKALLISTILASTSTNLTKLLVQATNHIAVSDYPLLWPELLPTLSSDLNASCTSGDANRCTNCLITIRYLCKRYEYKPREEREPINQIVAAVFPTLKGLLQYCLTLPLNDATGLMVKQALKIFWSTSQFYLHSFDPAEIEPWLAILHTACSMPLPPDAQPAVEPEKWVWWKVKKWATQIIVRIFSRYGNPKSAEQGAEAFADYFANNVASRFLGPVCELVALPSKGQFCSEKVTMACINYLDLAVHSKTTWVALKPHLDFIMYSVCFPALCLRADEVEKFENDPHEFILDQNSLMSEFEDVKVNAMTLISNLVSLRTKQTADKLMAFLVNILNSYPQTQNHVHVDAAMLVLAGLAPFLLKTPKYAPSLPALISSQVLPLFKSPVGFLRSRACHVVSAYTEVPLPPDVLKAIMDSVLHCLQDPALPVQVEASKALRFLLESCPTILDALRPVLPQLLTAMFSIMNTIGNDEVVASLDIIIEKFSDEISPHAVALVTNLSNSFMQYCREEDDEEGESAMAATQCLECIGTVLRSVHDRADIFQAVEPTILSVISTIMDKEGDYIEYLELALDLIVFLTFYQDEFTPALWSVFPKIIAAYHDYAEDYIGQMVAPLDNFISKDICNFCSLSYMPQASEASTAIPAGTQYIDAIMSMCRKLIVEQHPDSMMESDARRAMTLFMSIFHAAKQMPVTPMVDRYIPMVLDMVLGKLDQQKVNDMSTTRVQCYTVIGSLLYYNPQITFAELEKRNANVVFKMWHADFEELEKFLAKKTTVLGWLSVLSLGSDVLLRNGLDLPVLVRGAIELSTSLKDDYEGKYKNGEDGEDDEEVEGMTGAGGTKFASAGQQGGFEDDEEEEWEDEDGDIDDGDDYRFGGNVNDFMGMGFDDDDDDDDFDSPLDEVRDVCVLQDVLNGFASREAAVFEQVKSQLPPETLQQCAVLYQEAAKVRAEDEAAKAKLRAQA